MTKLHNTGALEFKLCGFLHERAGFRAKINVLKTLRVLVYRVIDETLKFGALSLNSQR